MKYKAYSTELIKKITKTIEEVKKTQIKPCVAFDADGTLWDFDLGETFFHYQIDKKVVPLPPSPWEHYLNMKKINNDPRSAYLWLAQICSGVPISTVREWAQKAFDLTKPTPIFEEQKRIIELFQKNNIDVYVVTASVKWAVEPGAKFLGIPEENVIGVQTKIIDGTVSDQQEGPITYRSGKVDGLLHYNGRRMPFFCSGNTMGDFDLLQSATHLRLAVSAAAADDDIYKTEMELQKKASELHWENHRFI